MSAGRRLVLVRHGRTAWNDSGRAQGHADVELDEVGHAQAAAVAAVLAGLRPGALWTSDLVRARETCAYVERTTGLAAKVDERLREYDVGARQGMDRAEFAEAFPAAYASWAAGDGIGDVPGAETARDVHDRMVPALREFVAVLDPGETGIVVTHGASLKTALCGLLGWPLELGTTMAGLDNCAWVEVEEIEAGGRLRLEGYNLRAPRPDFASAEGVG